MLNLILLRSKLYIFLKRNISRKKIIVLNSQDSADKIASIIQGYSALFKPATEILCFKSRIPGSLKALDGAVKALDDYLRYDDYEKIDRHIFDGVTKNWDKDKERSVFSHCGIELGRLVEYNLQLYLLKKVKAMLAISRAITRFGAEAVFMIDSNDDFFGMDKFIKAHHKIRAGLYIMAKKKIFIRIISEKITTLVSSAADGLAHFLAKKRKKMDLAVDARLGMQPDMPFGEGCVMAFFEKGLRLRLRHLLRKRGYVSFRVGPETECKKYIGLDGRHPEIDIKAIEKRFIFEKINYWELVKTQIIYIVSKDFPRIRKNIDFLKALHKKYAIKAIILRNDVREENKTAVFFAKKNGISTMVIQHGILAEPEGHNIIFADKVAVWGNRAAEWYKKYGNDIRKTVITGNLSFDRIFNGNSPKKKTNTCAKFRIRHSRRITLFTTGVSLLRQSAFISDDVTECLMRDVIEAIKNIGNINLIIKLHPNECLNAFSKFISKRERDIVSIVNNVNSFELIASSDALITNDSSVGLETVILGKPLITINLSRRKDLIPYAERNVAIGVYRKEDIEPAIISALNDETVKRDMEAARNVFINDFIHRTDGMSGGRIFKEIEKVSAGGRD